MVGLIVFAMLITLMSFGISCIKKIHMSIAIPVSFNGIALILYLFGLFNFLLIGVYVSIIVPIIFFALAIIKKKITKDELLQNLSSPAIFVWILSVAFVILIFSGRLIWMGDDLNHWALVIKNIYFNDRFCVGDNIYIYLTTYPEFNALPAYLALKLNGSFDEGILYAVNILWEIALLCPFFYNIKTKDFFKTASALFIIILLPLFYGWQVMFWNTLQIDILLGIAFSHCLILVVSAVKQNEKQIALIVGILVLTLLKLTGFYLTLFIIVVFGGNYFLTKKDNMGKSKEIVFLSVLALMGYLSWNIYIQLNHAVVWVNTNRYEGFSTVLEFMQGKGGGIRYDTLRRAVERVLSFEYAQIGSMNCYILWAGILLGGIILLGIIKKAKKKKIVLCCIMFILGFIIWWLGVLFVTIFKFSEEEMLVLSSYDRYLQTYFIGVLFAICGLLFIEQYKKKNIMIFCLILCLFMCTYKTIQFNIGYFYSSEESQITQRNNIQVKCEEFMKATEVGLFDKNKDRIYIISQYNGALSADYYDAEFLIAPIPVNLLCSYNIPANVNLSYCLGKQYSTDDIWTTEYSVEEFSDALEGYTYLLVLTCDKNFYNNYGSMFENGTVENGLYAIRKNGVHIMFERMIFD